MPASITNIPTTPEHRKFLREEAEGYLNRYLAARDALDLSRDLHHLGRASDLTAAQQYHDRAHGELVALVALGIFHDSPF